MFYITKKVFFCVLEVTKQAYIHYNIVHFAVRFELLQIIQVFETLHHSIFIMKETIAVQGSLFMLAHTTYKHAILSHGS